MCLQHIVLTTDLWCFTCLCLTVIARREQMHPWYISGWIDLWQYIYLFDILEDNRVNTGIRDILVADTGGFYLCFRVHMVGYMFLYWNYLRNSNMKVLQKTKSSRFLIKSHARWVPPPPPPNDGYLKVSFRYVVFVFYTVCKAQFVFDIHIHIWGITRNISTLLLLHLWLYMTYYVISTSVWGITWQYPFVCSRQTNINRLAMFYV